MLEEICFFFFFFNCELSRAQLDAGEDSASQTQPPPDNTNVDVNRFYCELKHAYLFPCAKQG